MTRSGPDRRLGCLGLLSGAEVLDYSGACCWFVSSFKLNWRQRANCRVTMPAVAEERSAARRGPSYPPT